MYKNILVSVDLNDPTSWQKALPTAVELCQSYSADLHVLAVMPDVGMSMVGYFLPGDYNDKVIAEARKKLRITCSDRTRRAWCATTAARCWWCATSGARAPQASSEVS